MYKKLIFIILFTMSSPVWAQSVASHYPASAFVVDRFLPFSVEGIDGEEIVRVTITNGQSCGVLLDPYYQDKFHILCRFPENFDAQIWLKDSSDPVELKSITVHEQSAPTDSFDGNSQATREAE